MTPDEVAALIMKPTITEAEMGSIISAMSERKPCPNVPKGTRCPLCGGSWVCLQPWRQKRVEEQPDGSLIPVELSEVERAEADAAYARWANSGAKERYEFERACRDERNDPTFGPRARGMT